jgi:hypothetical protein
MTDELVVSDTVLATFEILFAVYAKILIYDNSWFMSLATPLNDDETEFAVDDIELATFAFWFAC